MKYSVQMNEQKLLEVSVTVEELTEAIERADNKAARKSLETDLKMLTEMEEEASRFGGAVGLDSVSTFECIIDRDRHYFMEMNTRVQVEHPVTEMITGEDLVDWQFRVAAGERLPKQQSELCLTGHSVEVRQHAEEIEVFYKERLVECFARLRGEAAVRIDYRHVIWSLVRKPGAFAQYRYQDEMFPTDTFRAAYGIFKTHRGERADIEYVRVLHLAASTMESTVERALQELLAEGRAFNYLDVKDRATPQQSAVPDVHIGKPDLVQYDNLLEMTQ